MPILVPNLPYQKWIISKTFFPYFDISIIIFRFTGVVFFFSAQEISDSIKEETVIRPLSCLTLFNVFYILFFSLLMINIKNGSGEWKCQSTIRDNDAAGQHKMNCISSGKWMSNTNDKRKMREKKKRNEFR